MARKPFSWGRALCLLSWALYKSKEKALLSLAFKRQSWFQWPFALCPSCVH